MINSGVDSEEENKKKQTTCKDATASMEANRLYIAM